MNTMTQEVRLTGYAEAEPERLQAIRNRLERGDKQRIAERQGVSRQWVYKVLDGEGTSEPVLSAAEQLIHEREQQTN